MFRFSLFFNRFFDGLDGAMARISGPTDLGAFYDIVCDFIFYSAFPLAFIVLDVNNSYHIGFLLLSFVATQSTFFTSAWIIEKNKIDILNTQKKSFFYSGGITEGFETIICFSLMLIFYDFIEYISYTFDKFYLHVHLYTFLVYLFPLLFWDLSFYNI